MTGMPTDLKTICLPVDQMSAAGEVSTRQIFSDRGIYCNGRMVALTGEGQLFLEPNARGRAFATG